MSKWRVNLSFLGKGLRNLTNGETDLKNCVSIINHLEKCYEYLLKKSLFDDWEKSVIRECLEILDGDVETISDYFENEGSIFNYNFETAEELVNSRLCDFYDVCDNLRIWVGI